jgi:hypothetical protein
VLCRNDLAAEWKNTDWSLWNLYKSSAGQVELDIDLRSFEKHLINGEMKVIGKELNHWVS